VIGMFCVKKKNEDIFLKNSQAIYDYFKENFNNNNKCESEFDSVYYKIRREYKFNIESKIIDSEKEKTQLKSKINYYKNNSNDYNVQFLTQGLTIVVAFVVVSKGIIESTNALISLMCLYVFLYIIGITHLDRKKKNLAIEIMFYSLCLDILDNLEKENKDKKIENEKDVNKNVELVKLNCIKQFIDKEDELINLSNDSKNDIRQIKEFLGIKDNKV
jgi:hypothetical protein